MRIKFRNLMKATMNCGVFRKDSMIENEQIQKMAEASRRETNDVRKNLRKERSRAEAAQQRIAELDQVLQKRQQQIGELRRQVEMMRFTHKEHVQALQVPSVFILNRILFASFSIKILTICLSFVRLDEK